MAEHILFDLDNTLYPSSSGLEDRAVARMMAFAAERLGLSAAETAARRREALREYGTTLEWLRAEHGPIDPDQYYAAVHPEGEESILSPDPELDRLLKAHPARKWVFTNSPIEYAERVLARLGLRSRFEGVFDIRFCGFYGKPHPEAFELVLRAIGGSVRDTAFIDDSLRSVEAYRAMGGTAILVDELGRHPRAAVPVLRDVKDFPSVLG